MWYVISLVGWSCVGVLWIASEPCIRLRNFILRKHQGVFRRLLECAMCSSFHLYFWFQLLYFGNIDILGASICAVLSEILLQKLNGGL
jgi:hypothetical protein